MLETTVFEAVISDLRMGATFRVRSIAARSENVFPPLPFLMATGVDDVPCRSASHEGRRRRLPPQAIRY